MTDRDKEATSYRLTPQCKRLIEKLARKWATTRAQTIEAAIREKALRDGIKG